MGRGQCGRRRTTLGRGRYGRRRTTMEMGWYGRRRGILGRGGGVQEGGVPGRSEPEGGRAYQGGPLSSTIYSQAPASSEQQVD